MLSLNGCVLISTGNIFKRSLIKTHNFTNSYKKNRLYWNYKYRTECHSMKCKLKLSLYTDNHMAQLVSGYRLSWMPAIPGTEPKRCLPLVRPSRGRRRRRVRQSSPRYAEIRRRHAAEHEVATGVLSVTRPPKIFGLHPLCAGREGPMRGVACSARSRYDGIDLICFASTLSSRLNTVPTVLQPGPGSGVEGGRRV